MEKTLEYETLTFIGFGALGQVARILQGLKKAIERDEKIEISRIVYSLILGAIVGGLIGLPTKDWRMAFLGGYTGADFLEGIIKKA